MLYLHLTAVTAKHMYRWQTYNSGQNYPLFREGDEGITTTTYPTLFVVVSKIGHKPEDVLGSTLRRTDWLTVSGILKMVLFLIYQTTREISSP
jgi:hypothetical protein